MTLDHSVACANYHSCCKLLPKKDAAFNQVMDHLRPTGVEQLSSVYAFLTGLCRAR